MWSRAKVGAKLSVLFGNQSQGKPVIAKQAGVQEKQAGVEEKQAGVQEKQSGVEEKQAGVQEKQPGAKGKQAGVEVRGGTNNMNANPQALSSEPWAIVRKQGQKAQEELEVTRGVIIRDDKRSAMKSITCNALSDGLRDDSTERWQLIGLALFTNSI
jgi:hypothetical protein